MSRKYTYTLFIFVLSLVGFQQAASAQEPMLLYTVSGERYTGTSLPQGSVDALLEFIGTYDPDVVDNFILEGGKMGTFDPNNPKGALGLNNGKDILVNFDMPMSEFALIVYHELLHVNLVDPLGRAGPCAHAAIMFDEYHYALQVYDFVEFVRNDLGKTKAVQITNKYFCGALKLLEDYAAKCATISPTTPPMPPTDPLPPGYNCP